MEPEVDTVPDSDKLCDRPCAETVRVSDMLWDVFRRAFAETVPREYDTDEPVIALGVTDAELVGDINDLEMESDAWLYECSSLPFLAVRVGRSDEERVGLFRDSVNELESLLLLEKDSVRDALDNVSDCRDFVPPDDRLCDALRDVDCDSGLRDKSLVGVSVSDGDRLAGSFVSEDERL